MTGIIIASFILGIVGYMGMVRAYDDYEYLPFGEYTFYFVDMNAGDNLTWSFNTYAESFIVLFEIEGVPISEGLEEDSGIYIANITDSYLLVFVNLDIGLMRDGWIHIYFEVNVEPPPPPGPFTLTSTATNPDTDGSFSLQWTTSTDANNYSVYQDNVLLNSGLTSLSYLININTNGSYDFQITAFNNYGKTDSNEITVNIAIPPESEPESTEAIPSFNPFIIAGIIGVVAIIIIVKKRK